MLLLCAVITFMQPEIQLEITAEEPAGTSNKAAGVLVSETPDASS